MEAKELRARQAPLKDRYKQDPSAAMTPVRATADFSAPELGVVVETWAGATTAGPHPSTGGSGAEACSADMLLQAILGCVGVTMRSVATVMSIPIQSAELTATAAFDARGTLGQSREVPVGIQGLLVDAVLETDASHDQLEKLAELTERYCVVGQSLREPLSLRVRTAD